MEIFVLRALQGHLDDALLEGDLLLDDLLQLGTLLTAELSLARGTLEVVEDDARPVPLLLHLSLDAVEMKDMSTVHAHGRLLTDCRAVTDRTKLLSICFRLQVLWHLCDTFRLETRQTLGFAGPAPAGMTARQHLVTGCVHHHHAFLFAADISEGRLHAWRGLLQLFLTEATVRCSCLIASPSRVVGLSIAFGAEVFTAFITANSVQSQVLCGLF